MYKPGRTPKQYYEEIFLLAEDEFSMISRVLSKSLIGTLKFDNSDNVMEIINQIQPNIQNQVIFEIYYLLYLILEEKHSIYFYYKEREKRLGHVIDMNFKDDSRHNKIQNDYKTFRNNADDFAKKIYNKANIGYLYGKKPKNYEGHKLRRLDYLFLERILDDSKIDYFFDSLRVGRLTDNKKISNTVFKNDIIPAIQALYENIDQTDYTVNNRINRPFMLKAIDYYQLEKNCSIELSYMSAYALGKVKKTLKEKKEDLEVFHNLRFSKIISEGGSITQNKVFVTYGIIFYEYTNGKINAYNIRDIYEYFNNVIYFSVYNTLDRFFDGLLGPLNSNYWLNIYQNGAKLKKDLKLNGIDDFICLDSEIFFKNYLAKGQHINQKKWEEIKIKDFRDMYQPYK